MNYVQSLNVFGTEAKQIPCITSSGAPTTATEGAVGCLYMDRDTGDIYKCVSALNGVYDWKRIASSDDSKIDSVSAWSSKNTVDRLCPGFTENNHVAVCDPLLDYPLEITSTINAKTDTSEWKSLTLTQCGKNLFDFKQEAKEIHFHAPSGTDTLKHGYAIHLPAGTYTVHAKAIGEGTTNDKYVFCYANDVNGNYIALADILVNNGSSTNTYLRQGPPSSCTARTFAFDREVIFYVYQGGSGTSVSSATICLRDQHNIQIEVGSVKTDYEPYRGQTLTADISKCPVIEGSYNWTTGVLMDDGGTLYQHNLETGTFAEVGIAGDVEDGLYTPPIVRTLPATSGTNYFYSDCGNTEVKGKSDPVKIIENLTNAITALGANV